MTSAGHRSMPGGISRSEVDAEPVSLWDSPQDGWADVVTTPLPAEVTT